MKGLSPLVESILAIVITIVAVFIFSNFLLSASKNATGTISNQFELKQACSYSGFYVMNVSIETAEDCTRGVNHTLNVTVRNTGQVKLNIESIGIESLDGDIVSFTFNQNLSTGEIKSFSGISEESCSSLVKQNESYPGYSNNIRKIYANTDTCTFYNIVEGEDVVIYNGNDTESKSSRYLVGLWHFNNNLSDSSGYGHDGTFVGGSASYVSGKTTAFGNALQFDGVNDMVNVSSTNALNITDSITIDVWVKSGSNNTFIVAKDPTESGDENG